MKIAIIQPIFKNWDYNSRVNQALELLSKLPKDRIDLIVLPELFPGSYVPLQEKAIELGSYICCGETIRINDKEFYNASTIINPTGEKNYTHIKNILAPGEKNHNYITKINYNVFNINSINIGISICHELPMLPELGLSYFSRIELLLVPSLAIKSMLQYWHYHLIIKAIEIGVPVVFVNYAGTFKDKEYEMGGGRSGVYLPLPEYLESLEDLIKSKHSNPEDLCLFSLPDEEKIKIFNVQIERYSEYKEELIKLREKFRKKLIK